MREPHPQRAPLREGEHGDRDADLPRRRARDACRRRHASGLRQPDRRPDRDAGRDLRRDVPRGFATALPEISSGIAAVRLGDIQLAVGDILGGNSFQITLFLLADLLAGTPVIVAAHRSDVWLGALGLLMTGIAATAIIVRPQRCYLWLGLDSIVLAVIYALAIGALPGITED